MVEAKAGGSRIQGHHWLQNKFRANLGYMTASAKKPKCSLGDFSEMERA